jgi:hypothetical protein
MQKSDALMINLIHHNILKAISSIRRVTVGVLVHISQLCSGTFNSAQAKVRLSSIFQDVTRALEYPDQKEFLLRHVVSYTASYPALEDNCGICKWAGQCLAQTKRSNIKF